MSSFYIGVPKIMIIGYTVPEMWNVMDVLAISHFEQYFAFLPPPPPSPLTAQKMKI